MKDFDLIKFADKSSYNIDDLVTLVRILRDPVTGCKWDMEQTHTSVRHNFVEEAYEVVDAIDADDVDMLCEELGDVLLQVFLHTEMEYEKGTFDLDKVCDGICKKLIFRHPHIFADTKVGSTDDILKNWDELKKKEKSQKSLKDSIDGITKALPALMYVKKLQKVLGQNTVPKLGDDATTALQTVIDGANSLGTTPTHSDIGGLLYSVVSLSRACDIDPELALMEYARGQAQKALPD